MALQLAFDEARPLVYSLFLCNSRHKTQYRAGERGGK